MDESQKHRSGDPAEGSDTEQAAVPSSPDTGREPGQTVEASGQAPRGGSRLYREMIEWLKALAIAALLVFVIRWLLFAPFIVDGQSMEPNFESGERLIVNKIIYDIRAPQRGEVVVFYVPDEQRDFIKRIIGLPGDKVKLEGDTLYINGVEMDEPYLKEAIAEANSRGELYNTREGFPNPFITEDTVPEGKVLVFGDNRSNSKDSRMIGYVDYDSIVGRADFIFWPLDKLSLVGHTAPVKAEEFANNAGEPAENPQS
ncbi:signal peptidase I [Paenibacillus sambharensis]|uniref:Signal peptidase I n=1 Tax=Paenibacillus sambharensis TaxID=1803190 RepID=A0A2W1L1Q4_9BACL|nr:signal peptidase I [Paenibacillus sambharensis]PZD93306.1 signal peptidase I [Paenibacillus sambharensis]